MNEVIIREDVKKMTSFYQLNTANCVWEAKLRENSETRMSQMMETEDFLNKLSKVACDLEVDSTEYQREVWANLYRRSIKFKAE